MSDDQSDSPAYQRARKRIKELRDFYTHLGIYLAMILGLFLINLLANPRVLWFLWPTIGWGVIVLFHGVSLWIEGTFGQRWEERKTRQLMERERSRWGPQPPQPRAP
jgi:hypothetical protein